jgi:hypothetical protein
MKLFFNSLVFVLLGVIALAQDAKISDLPLLPQTSYSDDDLLVVVDTDDSKTKKTTLEEFDKRYYNIGNDIFKLGDGTAGAPAFSFTDEPDLGLYRSGSGELSLSMSGNKAAGFTESTSGFANFGIGLYNTSDSTPFYLYRSTTSTVAIQIENPSGTGGAGSGLTAKASGSNTSNFLAYPTAMTIPALKDRAAVRNFVGDGVSLIANDTGGDIRFYNEGQADTDESLRMPADHSLQFMQEISTPATPATGTNKLYFKSDAKIYRLDDAGAEKQVGSDINKFQTKILPSNVTTDTTAITFSNLVVGKIYEVSGQATLNIKDGDSGDGAMLVNIKNGATIVGRFNFVTTGSTELIAIFGVDTIFEATSTTATLETLGLASGAFLAGDGTRGKTYMTLTERNDLVETTDFN